MTSQEPLRIGLIGAGGIVRAHLPAFEKFPNRVKLAAVCDVREDAARKVAERFGISSVFTSAERMLHEANVDAVSIVTTHDTHAPLALAAIAAGKHVLVEKPMAITPAECQQMVDAADRARVVLMVAQCQRYDPSYRAVRRIITSGELGTIRAVRFDSMQNQSSVIATDHWLMDGRRAGGGVVISVSVHRIDLMRYLVGDVRRVTAVTRSASGRYHHGAEDYAAALLEFENGAVGEMFATCAGFRMPWGEQFMIFGDDGLVHAAPAHGQYMGPAMVATLARNGTSTNWDDNYAGFAPVAPDHSDLPTDDQFVNKILHFADCCRSGQEPLSSGRDNLGTMRTIFAIYQSAQENRPVALADIA